MRKKKQKPVEQKIAEEYFPVDETDLKHAVEKAYRPLETEFTQISQPKEREKRVTKTKKSFKKSKFQKPLKEYRAPPKITLKKDGYELIITEKPQAAMKIADSLGISEKRNSHGVPYYEVKRDGKRIIVACAVGHLFTLSQSQKGSTRDPANKDYTRNRSGYPVFDISWVPNYTVRKADFTKKYYDTLLSLAKNAGTITVATDYDIEGEVIGLNVMRFICSQKDANRMKFSTLTNQELNSAYETKSTSINWGQAIAGETRHYLDWFYGINLSRALMNSIKEAGRFKIMSIGRVQGPALNLIVERERKILAFSPQTYWQVFIKVKTSSEFLTSPATQNEVELKYNKDIFNKKELEQFNDLVGKTAIASTTKKEEFLPPNPPFNLTTLQMEAYRLHGLTPARTLQVAQSLYLAGLISYPRTSSQKLPDSINYREILTKLTRQYHVESLIKRNKPIEGKKSDPAHPSIYPTGEFQNLSGEEEKIYNLIAKRFLSLFCEDAIIDNKTITAKYTPNRKVDGQGNLGVLTFSTKGSEVKRKAWLEIYPYKIKETELPDMSGEVKITDLRTEEKETQPPKRYSPASIVSELEKRNLGTKATRASIIETLYDRGYVKERSIEATPLGISLITTLEKYSPIIIDEKLTRKFEKEMDSILESKKGFEEKEKRVIEEAKETIRNISLDFEKNKNEIGKELVSAEIEIQKQNKEENKLIECPVCKKGTLAITYSKKNRRYFVACNAYPECRNTYSLPPNSLIKKSDKICEECGFPLLISVRKGKRPWEFCFNKDCPKNKKRLEEYREKQNRENSELS